MPSIPGNRISRKMFAKHVFLLALALGIAGGSALAQQNISYNNSMFDCNWIESEYDRIIDFNENPVEESKGKLVLASILTAPFFIVERIMGLTFEEPKAPPLGGKVLISGNVSDVEQASINKNCYLLTDRILKDKQAGKLANLKAARIKSILADE